MASENDNTENKAERSYLSSAVDSLNPWAKSSRSSTPIPKDTNSRPAPSTNGDHLTTHLYGQSIKSYPHDCPPLRVLWFHAVDMPKRKPMFQKPNKVGEKPLPPAKKFTAFSRSDSRSIEDSYQELLEKTELSRDSGEVGGQSLGLNAHVPVNEDYLFDVNIEKRELEPVYWLGPVYEVRRGTWFYQEGSTLRPCDENLASQLEEGYLKVKPWLYPKPKESGSKDEVSPECVSTDNSGGLPPNSKTPAATTYTARVHQPESHRLFGTYMNSVATYQDGFTAWLSSDGMLSWVTSTVYQRFAGGGYMSGVKLVRGWSSSALETSTEGKGSDEKRSYAPAPAQVDLSSLHQNERQQRILKRRSAPPLPTQHVFDDLDIKDEGVKGGKDDPASEFTPRGDISLQSRTQKEIQDDYNEQSGESQGREIEHLILATHGIGQLLSMRMDSMNFVHDVDILRKTMKATYANSADLCALNADTDGGPKNCRVQVLPVCWRHLLDFPKKREKRGERDLGDQAHEDDEYPTLEDITIDGMTFARSLISDLALDVLLYQSAYRQLIAEIVLKEANRIFKLFKERNPGFGGKIHIIGHSLGSAVMFDILCRQRNATSTEAMWRNPLRFWPSQPPPDTSNGKDMNNLQFDFDVEDFYCLGSPVGLFQMLKGRTIAGRHLPESASSESPYEPDADEDPFAGSSVPSGKHISPITGLPFSVSSPRVTQLFNIFHPSDPISYRLEPLISPSLSNLKPQKLPYTKKNIFSNVAQQGLTGIGVKVGQSMSGLWTSLSAGITSNLLNRSLGLTSDDIAQLSSMQVPGERSNGGTVDIDDNVLEGASQLGERTNERKKQLADPSSNNGRTSMSGNDVTLIDDELETLLSSFQGTPLKPPKCIGGESKYGWLEEETLKQKAQREDSKIRALNRNGRVDYSIQESVLDFNPINTIASHMSYWADEDVSHFILSQLLSGKSRNRKSPPLARCPEA